MFEKNLTTAGLYIEIGTLTYARQVQTTQNQNVVVSWTCGKNYFRFNYEQNILMSVLIALF